MTAILMLAIALPFCSGCKKEAEPAAPAESAAKIDGPAAVQIVDLQGLKDAVNAHQGDVIYIDFWATWCGPCVKGLPELDELRKKYGERGLKIITVSFDQESIADTKVKQTLAKAGWSGQSLLAKDRETQNEIVKWLGKKWRSELPARYLFDRQGNPVREILDVTQADLPPVHEMIELLLGDS